MHDGSSIMHLFMNMYLLVILGSYLERLWGPKKYFILYIISALGAFALYNAMGMYQINELRNSFTGVLDINRIDSIKRVNDFNQDFLIQKWENLEHVKNELFPILEINVKVSSGFYIRQLVEDIGKYLDVKTTTFEIERLTYN